MSAFLADDARGALPGSREGVGPLRLHADDFRAAAEAGPHDRAAAGAAAAADRHEDDVGVRLLFEDLERVGADAGDQQRLVGGMDIAQAALVLQLLDALARLVEVAAELDQLGAVGAHRRVLLGIVAERRDDRARHALALHSERDRLAVVAGRRGDDAAPLVGGQSCRSGSRRRAP